jgi:hypothetical protein
MVKVNQSFIPKYSLKAKIGLCAALFGGALVIIFFHIFANASITESAVISLAMGIYFIGMTLMLADSVDVAVKMENYQIDNDRDKRLENIERIVKQWDRDQE